MSSKLNILIVGTGAVGSFYGGKLWQAGANVTTLCRSDYAVVKENGISIKSIWGDFLFTPHTVIHRIQDYSKQPDYIIVATKVLPGIDLPSMLKDKVAAHTAIVLLQNGIDIEVPIAEAFPGNEIISALAFICVNRVSYGFVEHEDYGRIVIGTYPCGTSEKVAKLASLFTSSGVDCKVDDDIIGARWIKLVWNAPFNPISVLGGGVTTREMLDSLPTKTIIEKVMKEVVLLSEQSGHPVPRSIIKKNIEDTINMTPYKTSMLLDFEEKRPMEVEAILGNALRIAQKYNVQAPHIESLYGLLSILNKKNTATE